MTHRGTIKSFNPTKGFGFIECRETFEVYGKDVFVLKTQLPGQIATAGDQVLFNVKMEHNGPVAIELQAVRGRSGGKGRPVPSSMPAPRTSTLALPPAGKPGPGMAKGGGGGGFFDPTYETSFVGMVKSFSHQTGWGMIECDLTMRLYGKDVFVSSKHLEGTVVSQGDQVRFVVKQEEKGPVAMCVQLLPPLGGKGGHSMVQVAPPPQQWGPPPPMQQWGPPPAPQWGPPPAPQWGAPPPAPFDAGQKVFYGVVKGFNEEKGWGHISCDGTKRLYNKDVFLLSGKLGGAACELGMLVSFKVQLGAKGPQAEQVQVMPAGSFSTEEQPGLQHSGTIKSFNEEKGFGFIASEHLSAMFGKDIFLSRRELGGYIPSIGDTVTFTVVIGEKEGQPQARDVVHEGSNGYRAAGAMAPLQGQRAAPY
mmetsp:Transcript_15564/g.27710  ORF Transcript_15564/g.27710 Transcript_15564/m.27710 type:complete len:421 (-) Transcript_15564:58-1320(-)